MRAKEFPQSSHAHDVVETPFGDSIRNIRVREYQKGRASFTDAANRIPSEVGFRDGGLHVNSSARELIADSSIEPFVLQQSSSGEQG
jgi:hypothetical protein